MAAPLNLGITGGVLFFVGALFGFWGFNKFLNYQISQTVQLRNGNEMRDNWAKFPISLEFRIYLFNLTNPEEVFKGGKPKVQEVGPYFFEEWKSKGNFEDDSSDDTVSFNMKAVWYFKPERSEGLTGNEMVTIPHPVLFGLVDSWSQLPNILCSKDGCYDFKFTWGRKKKRKFERLRNDPNITETVILNWPFMSMVMTVEQTKPGALPMLAKALPPLLNNISTPFVTARAMDIMFDGIPINCSSKEFGPKTVCTLINADPKGLVKKSPELFLFSFFGPKNDTFEPGKFTVKRGINDPLEVGLVVKYNDKPEMSTWPTPECNKLTGTDSTIFPPFIQDSDDIVSFSPDLCRSLPAKFRHKVTFKGIPGNHYTADLGDMSANEDEKCYCPTPTTCLKKGAFDITKCAGAPIVLTLPHYYLADPSYLDEVEGLHPDEEKHQIFLNFEPITGTPLAARKRLQFNIKSHPVKKIPLMKELPTGMIPIMWIEEGVELPQDFIDLLEANLFRAIRMVGVGRWIIMILGLGLIGGGVFLYYKRKQAPTNGSVSPKTVQVETVSAKY
uniref:Sensory neuron membrane protein 1-1 n=1 Tax=Cyrtorhinus lividipennis TaxID=1032904 RepID=A0A346TI33_9HEMI|nr:sensory neuron membrane protein 1-1 [Cyrtorhinus lividipennis]